MNELIDSKKQKDRLLIESTDFDEQKNRLLIVVVTNSLIDWLSKQKKSTFDDRFVDMKMFYVNFSFNSRRRHASWLFAKKLSFRWLENVLCKFFNQFTKIRFVVSWSFFKRISHWRSYLIIRVFRRAIFAEFDRMSISFAEFRTKNRVLKTVNHRHCWLKNSCWKCAIVTNWSILFLFTRWSFQSECEIYIVRHDENQI